MTTKQMNELMNTIKTYESKAIIPLSHCVFNTNLYFIIF